MTEAPERIWTHGESWSPDAGIAEYATHGPFISKATHDAAVSAARKEGWNAGINAAADEAQEHKHFANGIECCSECIRNMVKA